MGLEFEQHTHFCIGSRRDEIRGMHFHLAFIGVCPSVPDKCQAIVFMLCTQTRNLWSRNLQYTAHLLPQTDIRTTPQRAAPRRAEPNR